MSQRRQQLDWEARWALPTALAAFAAIGFVIVAIVIATQGVGGGGGNSELLRHVDEHRSAELISSILQAIGVGLLAAPLYYLFRSAKSRSERMRGQLVGVVIAAPLFLAALAILSGVSTLHAASDFVSNEVPRLMAKGVALNSDHANEIAKETISEAPLRPLAAGFGLGGQLGFLVGDGLHLPLRDAGRLAASLLGIAGHGPGRRLLHLLPVRAALVRLPGPAPDRSHPRWQASGLGGRRSDPLAESRGESRRRPLARG